MQYIVGPWYTLSTGLAAANSRSVFSSVRLTPSWKSSIVWFFSANLTRRLTSQKYPHARSVLAVLKESFSFHWEWEEAYTGNKQWNLFWSFILFWLPFNNKNWHRSRMIKKWNILDMVLKLFFVLTFNSDHLIYMYFTIVGNYNYYDSSQLNDSSLLNVNLPKIVSWLLSVDNLMLSILKTLSWLLSVLSYTSTYGWCVRVRTQRKE